MSELSPDQASDHQKSVLQAQEAARELSKLREKLESDKKEQDEKLKREMEGKEGGYRMSYYDVYNTIV